MRQAATVSTSIPARRMTGVDAVHDDDQREQLIMEPISSRESMTRVVLLDQRLPEPQATERIEARRIRMPARHFAGAHVHNCPVLGSIVAGHVRFRVAGQDAVVLGPGEVFYEPEGAVIDHFDALEEDVVFLAYFLLPGGQTPQIAPV